MTGSQEQLHGGQPESLGQFCVFAFVEALSQKCKSVVDVCIEMAACLAQGEKTATSLAFFLIFEWSLS